MLIFVFVCILLVPKWELFYKDSIGMIDIAKNANATKPLHKIIFPP
jgi:hypothetical protein